MKTSNAVLGAGLLVCSLLAAHAGLSTAATAERIPAANIAAVDPGKKSDAANGSYPEIGATLESLTSRYGKGLKNAFKIRYPGHDQYYWEINHLGLNVVMLQDKAVIIVAHRVGALITKEDIHDLLKANSDVHGWMEDPSSPRWLRRDNKVEAFREKRHEDMFFIEDIAVAKNVPAHTEPGSR